MSNIVIKLITLSFTNSPGVFRFSYFHPSSTSKELEICHHTPAVFHRSTRYSLFSSLILFFKKEIDNFNDKGFSFA